MAQVFINNSYFKIKDSVLMERPGVHVQSEVAAGAAMIKLGVNSRPIKIDSPTKGVEVICKTICKHAFMRCQQEAV